jgi:CRP/FNR family transcriptional regulator, cyclic AMP receptor protein
MADDPKRRAELLDATRWANDFSWSEIESLATHLHLVEKARGQVVCREGQADPSLYILVSGAVEVSKQDAGECEKLLARLGPGQTIGEMALLDGQPRSATAVAAEEVTLLVLHRTSLDRLVEEAPRLGVKLLWKLARFLSQRLRQTSGALAERMG